MPRDWRLCLGQPQAKYICGDDQRSHRLETAKLGFTLEPVTQWQHAGSKSRTGGLFATSQRCHKKQRGMGTRMVRAIDDFAALRRELLHRLADQIARDRGYGAVGGLSAAQRKRFERDASLVYEVWLMCADCEEAEFASTQLDSILSELYALEHVMFELMEFGRRARDTLH